MKEEFSFYVGVDWGVEFHQVCILDADGEKILISQFGYAKSCCRVVAKQKVIPFWVSSCPTVI